MNKLNMYAATVVSTVLAAPAALATASISTDATSDYFETNRAPVNASSQPDQPPVKASAGIPSRYLDANWTLFNDDGKYRPLSTTTHEYHDMTLEPGEE